MHTANPYEITIPRPHRGRAPRGLDASETPPWAFQAISAAFGPFALDAAATPANAKAARFYTPADDGLRLPWITRTFCNPPYSDKLSWITKAVAEAHRGVESVLLLPSDTSTAWFHRLLRVAEITLIEGRINFIGGASVNVGGNFIAYFDAETVAGLHTPRVRRLGLRAARPGRGVSR